MEKTDYRHLTLPLATIEAFAEAYYGIKAKAKPLPGEVDFNYQLTDSLGKIYTLKLSRPGTDVRYLEFQNSLLKHLNQQAFYLKIPSIIPDKQGKELIETSAPHGHKRWMRLQSWVPGRMLADIQYRSPDLLRRWGQAAGQLARQLQGFEHPFAHRFYHWDPSKTLFSRQYLPYIEEPEKRAIARHFWEAFEKDTLPKLDKLRKSVNYNDAHEHNLLYNGDKRTPAITGLIDFGDALFTHTINELAISCAYACMGTANVLEAASYVIQGFHEIFPLQEQEVEVLYSLITARLLITVSTAALRRHEEPDNEYLQISTRPAWDLLQKMKDTPAELAHYTFRAACGWEPCPKNKHFHVWLNERASPLHPLIKTGVASIHSLDMGVNSRELGNYSNIFPIEKLNARVKKVLQQKNAAWGISTYGEVRCCDLTQKSQSFIHTGTERPSIALGIDCWGEERFPIFAPLDGKVQQLRLATNGISGLLVLRHEINDQLHFYSIYEGVDLSIQSSLYKEKIIDKGQVVAYAGSKGQPHQPAHFSFQLALEWLEEGHRSAACPSESEILSSLFPDPSAFFPSSNKSKTSSEAASENMIAFRKKHLGKSLSLSYQAPLQILRGYKQYLFNQEGQAFLDTVNNVAHVGHEHPRVVQAAAEQTAILNTNTRYLHPNIIRFAEELLATFPPDLSVVHFVNSGSEANELALRMVQAHTGQRDMIALEVGYHGNTGGCIDISSYKFDGKGGAGAPPHTHILPIPDTYRGLHRDPSKAGKQYASYADQVVRHIETQGRKVGGFIAESIMSCGGQIVLPDGYLQRVYEKVRAVGGLCIADEVQVGFGRVGEKFWGFELYDVLPDIVTVGKPIGNGHPLAAVICTQEVADSFANGMEYFNTFGGNPVSCTIGLAVLETIREEELQINALQMGEYLQQQLLELQGRHPIIGEVRGKGLFLGFELVKDRQSLVPAAKEASYLANRMRHRGILMSTDGPFHNVLKIKPPLCFDQENADFLIENLDEVLSEDFMKQ